MADSFHCCHNPFVAGAFHLGDLMPRASDRFQKPIRADVRVVRLEQPDGTAVNVDLRQGYTPKEDTEPKPEKKPHD